MSAHTTAARPVFNPADPQVPADVLNPGSPGVHPVLTELGFSLKRVKSHMGRDSLCYSMTLVYEGVEVAHISDDGNGGECRVDWLNARGYNDETIEVFVFNWQDELSPRQVKAREKKGEVTVRAAKAYWAWRDALPLCPWGEGREGGFDYDDTTIFSMLVDTHKLIKKASKKLMFRLPDDEPNVYRHVTGDYDAKAVAYLKRVAPKATLLNPALGVAVPA